jgi:hypothetical protein
VIAPMAARREDLSEYIVLQPSTGAWSADRVPSYRTGTVGAWPSLPQCREWRPLSIDAARNCATRLLSSSPAANTADHDNSQHRQRERARLGHCGEPQVPIDCWSLDRS